MATGHKNVKTESKRKSGSEIQTPKGKLGVMIPGMGAVATTLFAWGGAPKAALPK